MEATQSQFQKVKLSKQKYSISQPLRTFEHVAVLVPCYNEEITVENVVVDFKKNLPGATVFVFDNNSSDQTAKKALRAGAVVVPSMKQGKGFVVRHMFDVVEAEVYVMVDGDGTYPASEAPKLIEAFYKHGADMMVGARRHDTDNQAFRLFHKFGNRLITKTITTLFQIKVTDVLSGYRVFSQELVKNLPLMSEGFEIETELTLQAATKGFKISEVEVAYGSRPVGSFSKLSTFSDGFLILQAITTIFKDYKPLLFFGILSLLFAISAVVAGMPPILDYYHTKFVTHVPLAILAAGLGVLSVLFLGIGLILDSTQKYHRELFEQLKKLKS